MNGHQKEKRHFFKRRILSLFLMLALFITFASISAFAATNTYTVDNDDAQGYSNDSVGFKTYMQGKNHYLGDARRQISGSPSNAFYRWNFPVNYKQGDFNCRLKVYLYDNSFTDRTAKYYANVANSYTTDYIGWLNQDRAPIGWYTFTDVKLEQIGQVGNRCEFVEVIPSKATDTFTGADGIQIRLW